MKKIILLFIVGFTTLMSIEFTMTESGLYPNVETPPPANIPASDGWVETPLPTTAFNVLNYGLKGDGVTDDSVALTTLAKNTNVTNWYFPAGKTFLLSRINVPSHVVAIYGGATIISKGYSATYPEGAFNLNNSGYSIANNFIIDGLNFKRGSGFSGDPAYGQITIFQYGSSSSGVQIRNCSFDSTNFDGDCIAGFGASDGSITHDGMRIYNNTFTNIQAIAVEMFDKEKSDTAVGFTNTYIYNNTFTGGNGMAISMAGVRNNFHLYNNQMTNIRWGIECAECDNGFVYNNYMKGITKYTYSDSIKWNGPFSSPGVIKVHHNHFEGNSGVGGTFDLYNGGPSEVYENYIRGYIHTYIADFGNGPTNTIMGNIHDNTVVLDFAHDWTTAAVVIADMNTGNFDNNDVYNTLSGKIAIKVSNSSTAFTNNNIYVNGGNCISGAVQTGGSCDTTYTGAAPTSRPGSGLLP